MVDKVPDALPATPVRQRDAADDLIPELATKARRLRELASGAGVPIKIVSTYRSWQEQDRLYRKGRSTAGPRVTNARGGSSWHNFRRAFDVAFLKDGRVTWDAPEKTWELIGRIGEQLGLEWGGRWTTFQDLGHFQLTGGMSLANARKMYQMNRGRGIAVDKAMLTDQQRMEMFPQLRLTEHRE